MSTGAIMSEHEGLMASACTSERGRSHVFAAMGSCL